MTSSVLDEKLVLAELVDTPAFREVCMSFTELFGVGIKVFDTKGGKIVDVRASTGDHCGYLYSLHPTRVECSKLVGKIRSCKLEAKDERVEISCFSGLRYQVLPILYEGSLMGRVIFGPYREPTLDKPPEALRAYQSDGLSLDKLGEFLAAMPQASEEAVQRVLGSISNVLAVITHNSYKMLITSRLHIASISEAYANLRRSHEELHDAHRRLREVDRLKSSFVATVSHELRTPLTSVIGYSEMLLDKMAGDLNEEQREYVGVILEKGESLLALISQVLDLSRVESGSLVIQRQSSDIRSIIRLCVSDVLPQAEKNAVRIKVKVADNVPPISVDADRIRRVITNLLSNATKFTEAGGHILVSVDTQENLPVGATRFDIFEPERNRYLRIKVIDSGIGIPVSVLGRVFDAFFQVENTTTRSFGGTGLGLNIARHLIHAHGGRIEVESELGEGSTFTVRLPYVSEPVSSSVDGFAAEQDAP